MLVLKSSFFAQANGLGELATFFMYKPGAFSLNMLTL